MDLSLKEKSLSDWFIRIYIVALKGLGSRIWFMQACRAKLRLMG
jgi:hypothetical protein